MKTCFKCGESKELSEFYRHPKMVDGYLGKCKQCTRKDVKDNRDKNLERYRAYDRYRYETQPQRKQALLEYGRTEAFKISKAKANKKYCGENHIKRHAQYLLCCAVREKRITRGNCEICGDTENVHGHHDNYYKPLEVRWLCSKCHGEFHKNERNKHRMII
ncbi:MAG TPA: hypothetical protein ENH82_14165 [bacterium]|nr:hypothetical protein [bacterium]